MSFNDNVDVVTSRNIYMLLLLAYSDLWYVVIPNKLELRDCILSTHSKFQKLYRCTHYSTVNHMNLCRLQFHLFICCWPT